MRNPSGVLAGALILTPLSFAQTPYSGHGAASLSPGVVERFAPPALDPGVSRRIEAMLDLSAPGAGLLSPDGRRLFFDWSVTGTPQVWRVDGPRSYPVQMTGGEDRTTLADVTPDGLLLVLSRDRGGREDPGLYLQSVEGGPLRPIQHVEGARALYGFTTADVRWIYYVANDVRPDSYAVYRWNTGTARRELLVSELGLWRIADHLERSGEVRLLLRKETGALSAEYYEWIDTDRTVAPLLGQGERTEYVASYLSGQGELLVVTNKFGEFRRPYRWTARSGFSALTDDLPMDVSGCRIDDARKRVYCTLNDRGYTRLRAFDAKGFAPLPFPELKEADLVVAGGATPDGRYLTLGVETARAPRTSYVWDCREGTLAQWVLPSSPEVDTSRFAIARLESYPARDGTTIPMFVRYPDRCAPEAPPPDAPCPIVVSFHGGPEGQSRPGFNPTAQLFVDAGFVYAQPNVRGSDGYGRSWLDADNGPRRLEVITDVEDAGRHLRARFSRAGETAKVAVTGGSYGGYSALMAMTMFAGAYDAGVSVVGISDLRTFLRNTAPYRRVLRVTEYGDPERDTEALRRLSPMSYLDRVRSPLLLIQGLDDPRVPAGESLQIHEALQTRGVPSQLILLEGEGHGAIRRPGRAIVTGHTLRFFEEHLLGRGAAPGP